MGASEADVEVGGRRLRLTNLDKVLYPEAGFTKAEVIHYFAQVAPVLLAHLRDRPLTVQRFPDGVGGESFFEKNCPSHAPAWIPTVQVGRTNHCVVTEEAAIVWLANLAALELHVPMGTAADVETPTAVVFDLDPGPGVDVVGCAELALRIRDLLAAAGLSLWAKTSGSKGLQLYLPLNTPVSYAETTPFAHGVARLLERQQPDRVTSVMRKEVRPGKVFVDWSQNVAMKTTICAYSLRPRPRPTVSTPITWDEVERSVDAGDAAALTFEADEVLRRVDDLGDLFADVLTVRQELPSFGSADA